MILIGLCGRAGAGKDSVAEHLVIHHGFDAMAFAEPLYAGLAAMLGLPVEDLEDRDMKERPIDWVGKSPRELLQELGTGFGRARIHQDIWVLVAARALADLQRNGGGQRVVFTDVRFENEADWIVRQGGVLWEVYGRAGLGVRAHESEAGIPAHFARRSIWNGGAWEDTARQVDAAVGTEMRAVQ